MIHHRDTECTEKIIKLIWWGKYPPRFVPASRRYCATPSWVRPGTDRGKIHSSVGRTHEAAVDRIKGFPWLVFKNKASLRGALRQAQSRLREIDEKS
jgi:hypothetical protein